LGRGVIKLGDQIIDIISQKVSAKFGTVSYIDLKNAFVEALRKEIFEWRHPVVSYSGFKYRILFYRFGYSPHYAEHVIDPVDGREKLVLAVPHTTPNSGKIVIYDIEEDTLEEIDLKGLVTWSVSNPHTAHMIVDNDSMNPVTGSWAGVLGSGKLNANPGDIFAPAPDNSWVVIDRKTKSIKQRITPAYGAGWLIDAIPSINGDGLIVTDYQKGAYKIGFDGSTKWGPLLGNVGARLTKIHHALYSGVESSFGGDYIVCKNYDYNGVYELKDNGTIVWKCEAGPSIINNFLTSKPFTAFRLGVAELEGNLTVVGFEAGGGILALDRNCRPRWGIMKPYTNIPGALYRPTSFGLMETTHVFPTLRGTIGFIDWSGYYGTVVGEILEIPYHQTLTFLLAQDHDPGDTGTYYDPPVDTLEWKSVKLTFINYGNNSLDYTVYATNMNFLDPAGWPSHWKVIANGSLAGGSVIDVDASGYLALRVFGKRTTAGSSSIWKIIVTLSR